MLDHVFVPQQAVEPRYVEALHLAWAASRGQSLFAARCLVATALELHVRGATATDVHMSLAFAGAPPFPRMSCVFLAPRRIISIARSKDAAG